MKILRLICLFACLVSYTSSSYAQFVMDIGGKPLLETKYTNIKGTPFFNDEYLKGLVKLKDNLKPINVLLKYDILAQSIIVKKDASAAPMEVTERVDEFKIVNALNDTTIFKSIGNEEGYFEVIYSDKVSLLKKSKKRINETTAYNSATVERSINTTFNYFILNSNKELIAVKLDKKSFVNFNPAQSKSVEAYIAKEKIDFKSNDDLKKLMKFINQ